MTRSSDTELALQDTEGRQFSVGPVICTLPLRLRVRGSCKVGGSVLFALCKTMIRQKNDALQLKTCLKTLAVFR
jgi:hypothetical protein